MLMGPGPLAVVGDLPAPGRGRGADAAASGRDSVDQTPATCDATRGEAVNAPSSDILLDRMMSLHPKIIDLTLDRMAPHPGGPPTIPSGACPPVIPLSRATNGQGLDAGHDPARASRGPG